MKTTKLLMTALLAVLFSFPALAGDFFDSTLTIQGRTLDLGEASRTTSYALFVTGGTLSATSNTPNDLAVDGNVGVNGSGISLTNSDILGDATLKTGGNYTLSGSSHITGARQQNSSYIRAECRHFHPHRHSRV